MEYSNRFKEITKLAEDLNNIQDLDLLLEKILLHARSFVNADAGSIYIREGNELKFSYAQNQTLQDKLPAGRKLIYTIFKIPINQNSISGYVAETGKILNIEDVYNIPKDAPYSFNKDYDKVSNYHTKSTLTIPLKTNLGEVCGVLQVINAKEKSGKIIPFSKRDEPYMLHFANTASMVLQRAKMTRALLIRMIQMTELHDPKETGAHVNRVAAYSVEIYERWAHKNNIPEKEIEKNRDMLRMAAMLHDVGKIAVSDLILKKPSSFTEKEYEVMKAHTYLGAKLFNEKQSDFDEMAAMVALNHHENWDGSGYPGFVNVLNGKPVKTDKTGIPLANKGKDIPLYGRIVALADVYDALSSKRVYKDAWPEEAVLAEIKNLSGIKFDPELIEVFFESLDDLRSLAARYTE